jgi:hypothetical protein
MKKLLINGLVPKTGCEFCKSRRKMQDEVVASFKRRFRSVELFSAQQQPQEITGVDALLGHFRTWDRVQSRVK